MKINPKINRKPKPTPTPAININNYEFIEDYFNLYLNNNQKLFNIIADNVNTYNFDYNFKSYFRNSNSIITRTLSEKYNLIFIINALIEKNIIGYCIKTRKKYICEKFSYEPHNTFLYYKIAYHFNCKDDEFIIYFSWEYFSPIAIKYIKKNNLINISYRYTNEEINNLILNINDKNTKTIINKNNKLVYAIGIIPNAGHYFWNEIMGILFIIKNNLLNNIDHFIIGINDYLNFKDILKNKFNIPDSKLEILYENNLLDKDYVLINNAKNHINNELIILFKELYNLSNIIRNDKHINILFDIRTNDRICLNQYELIKNIIINIPNKYKDNIFNFSVSGWFFHNSTNNNTNNNIIKQKEIINELKQNFTINDLIGLKLEDLIKNVENIDIIISNSGSGVSFFSSVLYNPYNISFTNIKSYDTFKEQDIFLNIQNNIYIDKCFINSDINNNLNFSVDIIAVTNLVENIIDKII